jgi:hypothetical protein
MENYAGVLVGLAQLVTAVAGLIAVMKTGRGKKKKR